MLLLITILPHGWQAVRQVATRLMLAPKMLSVTVRLVELSHNTYQTVKLRLWLRVVVNYSHTIQVGNHAVLQQVKPRQIMVLSLILKRNMARMYWMLKKIMLVSMVHSSHKTKDNSSVKRMDLILHNLLVRLLLAVL